MDLLWPQLRPEVGVLEMAPLAVLFAVLLGFLVWSDVFRDRYTPDRATLPLLAAAWVVPPLLFQNLVGHYVAAVVISLFLLLAWFFGAWADGDLKIFLAYAFLLALAALPVLVLACLLILLYSIPTMIRTWPNRKNLPRGERLGAAPGVPGIALALPLGIALWVDPLWGGAFLLLGVASFSLSLLFGKSKAS